MSESDRFGTSKTDLTVAALKSSVGVIPVLGPLFAEIIGTTIPKQRMDRIADYITKLSDRLQNVEIELEETMNDEEKCNLFEEGVYQAAKSISEKKRGYIASIIKNGLVKENISYSETKHFMIILEQLSDIEVVLLCAYDRNRDYHEKHKDVLYRVRDYEGPMKERLKIEATHNSYINNLERLGLIKAQHQGIGGDIDCGSAMPELDTGQPPVIYYFLSPSGKLFLEYIGYYEKYKISEE